MNLHNAGSSRLFNQQFSPEGLTETGISSFQDLVFTFYEGHGRHDLAWRHTDDPYKILISEIMLQQTQVERVSKKYPEFIDAFPDIASLSRAPLSGILESWQGLGYNRRAVYLKKCAEIIENEYKGAIPRDPVRLATLPGIGKATASSICAFAFNLPVIFIETNIRRVFIHFFFSNREKIPDQEIFPLVECTLDREHPRIWYWAMMDMGTELKKHIPNPNRKSSGYQKQSSFAGSNRQFRGSVLKYLVQHASADTQSIARHLKIDEDKVLTILKTLENEGFVQGDNRVYSLSE